MSKGHDPIAIANYFIKQKQKEKSELDLMQLLKLSYIAHGLKLGFTGEVFSNESVEAWKYGPVFSAIYYTFKNQLENITKTNNEVPTTFTSVEYKILELTYKIYGKMSGWVLSELTHKKGSPWDITWNKDGGKNTLRKVIPNDYIKKYFELEIIPELLSL